MSPPNEWDAAHRIARGIPRTTGPAKREAISALLAMLLDLLRGAREWN